MSAKYRVKSYGMNTRHAVVLVGPRGGEYTLAVYTDYEAALQVVGLLNRLHSREWGA